MGQSDKTRAPATLRPRAPASTGLCVSLSRPPASLRQSPDLVPELMLLNHRSAPQHRPAPKPLAPHYLPWKDQLCSFSLGALLIPTPCVLQPRRTLTRSSPTPWAPPWLHPTAGPPGSPRPLPCPRQPLVLQRIPTHTLSA